MERLLLQTSVPCSRCRRGLIPVEAALLISQLSDTATVLGQFFIDPRQLLTLTPNPLEDCEFPTSLTSNAISFSSARRWHTLLFVWVVSDTLTPQETGSNLFQASPPRDGRNHHKAGNPKAGAYNLFPRILLQSDFRN